MTWPTPRCDRAGTHQGLVTRSPKPAGLPDLLVCLPACLGAVLASLVPAVLTLGAAVAQPAPAERDPTQPPAMPPRPPRGDLLPGQAGAAPVERVLPELRHVVIAGSQRWVYVGMRRYAVGDQLAGWRIHCIDSTGVVLTDDQSMSRRVPVHPGVSIRPALASAAGSCSLPAGRRGPDPAGGGVRPVVTEQPVDRPAIRTPTPSAATFQPPASQP